jgi:cytoskeleton-associated protein 5
MKFLVRCLRTTRDVPSKQEIGTIVESAKKLLSESSEALRAGGAEILGTVMKIIGERAMNTHLEGLDEIRKTKIKEFYEAAEVKAKEKPKAPPPAARAPPGGPKKVMGGKRPPAGMKKPGAAAAPPSETAPAARPGPASKLGMPKPGGLGGLKPPQKRTLGGPASPRRPAPAPSPPPMEFEDEEEEPVSPPPAKPASRLGLGRGGLAGRSLAKPAAPSMPVAPPSPTPTSSFTSLDRAELEELRSANERLLKQIDDARHDRSKLMSEIQELKNQNAGLIEDHTRDVLSIKAKETQLVRARGDAEAAEQTNDRLRRELDRLKRALNKAEALNAHGNPGSPIPGSPGLGFRTMSPTQDDGGIYRDGSNASRNRMSMASTLSEEKENGEGMPYPRAKFSPDLRYTDSNASSGRGSPARGFRRDVSMEEKEPRAADMGYGGYSDRAGSRTGSRTGGRETPTSATTATSGMESWKRAAEVTSQLKARIEQMKVCVASKSPTCVPVAN